MRKGWLFLSIPALFLFGNVVFANDFYAKVEVPLSTKLIKEKHRKSPDNGFVNIRTHDRLEASSAFGIGYNVSDYFEVELMYGQSKYNFEAYDTKTITSYFKSAIKQNLFSFAYKASLYRPAICCDLESGFVTKKEICGDGLTSTLVVSGLHASTKVQTIVISAKFKPFRQINLFSPYFSVGIGGAHSKSKYTYSFHTADFGGAVIQSSKGTKVLALEFGVGTKVKLTEKVGLDGSVKYFDYGKHRIVQDILKRIKGYKLAIGITVAF